MSVIKDYFGIKLKKLRKSRKLTQEKLAELLEINQRQLTRIETGKSYPSFKTVEKICEVFLIEPYELFDFTDIKNKSSIGKNDYDENILNRIKQFETQPHKMEFFNLAVNALNKDKHSLLKMQSIIEGMLLID